MEWVGVECGSVGDDGVGYGRFCQVTGKGKGEVRLYFRFDPACLFVLGI